MKKETKRLKDPLGYYYNIPLDLVETFERESKNLIDKSSNYEWFDYIWNEYSVVGDPEAYKDTTPPLGLKPEYLYWEGVAKRRVSQIQEAIERYELVDKEIPTEWLKEVNWIIDKFYV